MNAIPINVKRTDAELAPDPARVLRRSFTPGDVPRLERIVTGIMSMLRAVRGAAGGRGFAPWRPTAIRRPRVKAGGSRRSISRRAANPHRRQKVTGNRDARRATSLCPRLYADYWKGLLMESAAFPSEQCRR